VDKHRIYSRIYPWVVIACGAAIVLGLGLSGHYRRSIALVILFVLPPLIFGSDPISPLRRAAGALYDAVMCEHTQHPADRDRLVGVLNQAGFGQRARGTLSQAGQANRVCLHQDRKELLVARGPTPDLAPLGSVR
jgi:hypothetical protein